MVDNLTRQIEANYAETRKDDGAKEIWTCFELFVSENFAEGNGQQARKMKEFLKGVTDAINVKLVRVYDDNTTSLAWKLAGESKLCSSRLHVTLRSPFLHTHQ